MRIMLRFSTYISLETSCGIQANISYLRWRKWEENVKYFSTCRKQYVLAMWVHQLDLHETYIFIIVHDHTDLSHESISRRRPAHSDRYYPRFDPGESKTMSKKIGFLLPLKVLSSMQILKTLWRYSWRHECADIEKEQKLIFGGETGRHLLIIQMWTLGRNGISQGILTWGTLFGCSKCSPRASGSWF